MLLPARQAADPFVGQVGQADFFEQLGCPPSWIGHAIELAVEAQVLGGRQLVVQVGRVADDADQPAYRSSRLAHHQCPAPAAVHEPGEDANERRFAGAIRPKE